MKTFMIVVLSLVVLAGAGLGWVFAAKYQALQASHAEALGHVAELERTVSSLKEERDKAVADARAAGDELTAMTVRFEEASRKYDEVADHLRKMSSELFAAKDAAAKCEKNREDAGVKLSRMGDERDTALRDKDREIARLRARLDECGKQAAAPAQNQVQ